MPRHPYLLWNELDDGALESAPFWAAGTNKRAAIAHAKRIAKKPAWRVINIVVGDNDGNTVAVIPVAQETP